MTTQTISFNACEKNIFVLKKDNNERKLIIPTIRYTNLNYMDLHQNTDKEQNRKSRDR